MCPCLPCFAPAPSGDAATGSSNSWVCIVHLTATLASESAARTATPHLGLEVPTATGLSFRVLPGAALGVEVRGVVWDRRDPEVVRLVNAALRRHLLLVLRGQFSPSEAQLDGWLRQFGRLTLETFDGRAHYAGHLNKLGGTPSALAEAQREYMSRAEDNAGSTTYRPGAGGISELVWHNDQSHRPMLKVLSVLEMVELDGPVTPTEFRDMYTACECLGSDERERWARRQVVYFDPRMAGPDEHPRLADATHPLVLAHPHSGRRAIFVNDFADRVVGLDREESDALLTAVRAHTERTAPRLVHHWELGDVVLWDNIGLQHRRSNVPPHQVRVLRQHGGLAE